jgi:hypothetical protein
LRSSYVSGQYTLAQANTGDNSAVIGIVSNVIDANTFEMTKIGEMTLTTGFAIGDSLWLSPTTAGLITNVEPTTVGQVAQPLGYVVETNTIDVKIQRGNDISNSGGGSNSIASPGIERLISDNARLLSFSQYLISESTTLLNGVHTAHYIDSNSTYQSVSVPISPYTPPWGATAHRMMSLTVSEDKSKLYQTRNYTQGVGAQQALVVDEIDTSLNILNTYVYVSAPIVIQFSVGFTFVDGNKIIIGYTDTPTAIGNPFFATEFTMSAGLLITPTATNMVIGTQGVGSSSQYGYGYKHSDGFVYLDFAADPQNTIRKFTYTSPNLSTVLDTTTYQNNTSGITPDSAYEGFEITGTDVGWYRNTGTSPNRFIYQIYPF